MQFTADSHAAVADGTITTTIRRWSRPQVKVGGRYRVGAVVVEVDEIDLVPFGSLSAADIRATGERDRDAVRRRAAHAGPIDDDTLVYRIALHVVGPWSPSPVVTATPEAVAAVCAKLDAMDARSARGPWTRDLLRRIGDAPGLVSTEIAAALDRPRADLKADVRKLKALGLTESLEVGYRLTALGSAVVDGPG
jgi:hypothetical protein